jgi:hypothetical protein
MPGSALLLRRRHRTAARAAGARSLAAWLARLLHLRDLQGLRVHRPLAAPPMDSLLARNRDALARQQHQLIQSLTYLRIRACDMLAVSCQTDLKGAFDTISHKMTDHALKEAGASDKCRNLFRFTYQ